MSAGAETAMGVGPVVHDSSLLDDMCCRIDSLELDLSGLEVITEAATGAYSCTAVIAALAGAERVTCTARDTVRYGRFEDAAAATMALAHRAGVAERIEIHRNLTPEAFATCDILTNSGHLRPITQELIDLLPQHAVIALMFEAWEFRPADLDLSACRARGIRIAAVNEQHPDVAVFPLLGSLCVKLLADASMDVNGARVGLVCDNPFAPHLRDGLVAAGAIVTVTESPHLLPDGSLDAVVIALNPETNAPLDHAAMSHLSIVSQGGVIAQFWGDICPEARRGVAGCRVWPPEAPGRGHMGILLNALGHDPIVRLQTGGLRAAEIVRRGLPLPQGGIAEIV